jgi:preprotein translocase SecE subunit
MASKRQRAKARKQRLHRENVPGSLDHASGEVEEVEAAIVAGAGGVPVEPAAEGVADEPVDAVEPDDGVVEAEVVEPEPAGAEPVAAAERAPQRRRNRRRRGAAVEPLESPEPLEPLESLEPLEPGAPLDDDLDDDDPHGDDADAESVERGRLGRGAGDLAATPDAHRPVGFRVTNFIRACWAELQRVDWPDRRQVGQATAVVLGFVVVAGAFLGLADVVAQRIVDFIL